MKKLVFLTGAGVSAESGIKTFRDAGGVWEGHNVMDVASPQGWRRNKELVLEFYNQRNKQLSEVEPNEGHKIIAELEKLFDVTVITQNVDDLHERAGTTNVFHLHGELTKMCSSIDKEKTLPYQEIKVGHKHEDGSQLRPYIVWFGEDVPTIGEASNITNDADIFVVVGTSLQVYPAAGLIEYAKPEAKLYYIDPNPSLDDVTRNVRGRINVIQKVGSEGMKELFDILSKEDTEE
jgi:NAD-dependent deacetylase